MKGREKKIAAWRINYEVFNSTILTSEAFFLIPVISVLLFLIENVLKMMNITLNLCRIYFAKQFVSASVIETPY